MSHHVILMWLSDILLFLLLCDDVSVSLFPMHHNGSKKVRSPFTLVQSPKFKYWSPKLDLPTPKFNLRSLKFSLLKLLISEIEFRSWEFLVWRGFAILPLKNRLAKVFCLWHFTTLYLSLSRAQALLLKPAMPFSLENSRKKTYNKRKKCWKI